MLMAIPVLLTSLGVTENVAILEGFQLSTIPKRQKSAAEALALCLELVGSSSDLPAGVAWAACQTMFDRSSPGQAELCSDRQR